MFFLLMLFGMAAWGTVLYILAWKVVGWLV